MPATVQDVLDAVADGLHLSGGASALEPWWTGVATRALADANADVNAALLGRGFSPVQIADWPDLTAVVRAQAVFWAATSGGAYEAFDDKFVKAQDRREWLKTAPLADASGGLAGSLSVGHGSLRAKAKDPPVFPGDTFVDSEGNFRKW